MSVYSWFTTLEESLYDALEWVDSAGLFRLRSFLNALREGLMDEPAPGASTQRYYGHDHAPDTASGEHGGRPVARGTMFQGGSLQQTWLRPNIAAAATWTRADNALTTARPSQMFYVPVSQGMISSGAPPVTAPYLEALLHVYFSVGAGTPSLDMRMQNLSWGGNSQVTAITAGAGSFQGLVTITGIPCTSGWNRLILEVRSNLSGVASLNVDILDMIILERPALTPVSAGSDVLGGAA